MALQALRDLELDPGVVDIAVECDLATRVEGSGRFREWRQRVSSAPFHQTPEQQGQDAARAIRSAADLDGQPLEEAERFVERLFDIRIEDRRHVATLHDHTISGAHVEGFGMIVLLGSPQLTKAWSYRMELFRATGHLLLDAGAHGRAIGAGSSNRSVGWRRRRSGAFAAEMLLPREAIRQRCDGVLDKAANPEVFKALMSDFGVGAQTAAWQCYNSGFLSSTEVVEDLIATYGGGQAQGQGPEASGPSR